MCEQFQNVLKLKITIFIKIFIWIVMVGRWDSNDDPATHQSKTVYFWSKLSHSGGKSRKIQKKCRLHKGKICHRTRKNWKIPQTFSKRKMENLFFQMC